MVSTLLDLQTQSTNDPSALNALQEGQNRVHSVALIHQKLYQDKDISHVDIQDYVTYLTTHLADVFFKKDKSVDFNINIENKLMLDIDIAIPISLILNELITNSFKYAFNQTNIGRIDIKLIANSNGYEFEYKDNGPGFNPKEVSAESLGMKLIRILSEQLKSETSWNNSNQTIFKVNFSEIIETKAVA